MGFVVKCCLVVLLSVVPGYVVRYGAGICCVVWFCGVLCGVVAQCVLE